MKGERTITELQIYSGSHKRKKNEVATGILSSVHPDSSYLPNSPSDFLHSPLFFWPTLPALLSLYTVISRDLNPACFSQPLTNLRKFS